jgi:hypothetical protein
LGDWLAHPIGGGALIDSSLVPVCLLNRDTSAFHGLLARWQQVVLEQTHHFYRTIERQIIIVWPKRMEKYAFET